MPGLNLGTVDILGWVFFGGGVGGRPGHCRMFSCIHGLHPLDASTTPAPSCDNLKRLPSLPSVWEGKRSWFENMFYISPGHLFLPKDLSP